MTINATLTALWLVFLALILVLGGQLFGGIFCGVLAVAAIIRNSEI